jgi:eukaryotic-like serine/threonine-protein kinase
MTPTDPREPPEQFGRYRILRRLGRGGMGSVYLAEDTELGRLVALKVPDFGPGEHPDARERFRREARAAATLDHPNLCPIFDVGRIDGIDYLTMPYIEGKPLSALIGPDRPTLPRQAAAVARKLALAMAEAHRRGIVHRDLKPANVMVDRKRELVILDFGLARRADAGDSRLTRAGSVLGTPAYMAPEQLTGEGGEPGPGCDIYALGVILYELLTGRCPFEGPPALVLGLIATTDPPPPSSFRPGIDPRMDALCLRALARRADHRYPSMGELAAALGNYLAEAGRLADTSASLPRVAPAAVAEAAPRTGTERLADQFLVGRLGAGQDKPPPVSEVGDTSQSRWLRRPATLWLGFGAAVAVLLLVAQIVRSGRSGGDGDGAGGPAWTDTNSIGMSLVLVPRGEFRMGAPDTDKKARSSEKPQHPVLISRPFYLGAHEVTVGQFGRFVEATGYKTDAEAGRAESFVPGKSGNFTRSKKHSWSDPGFAKENDHPVAQISWDDALAFCEWLSRAEDQTYRLPTEAEWEYACRAGTMTRFTTGDEPESLEGAANVADRRLKEEAPQAGPGTAAPWDDGFAFTSPVGRFRPNAWGLYDMHGNVWEWCADSFGSYKKGEKRLRDPRGPHGGGPRVQRGGSFAGSGNDPPPDLPYVGSAGRRGIEPGGLVRATVGFRVVRECPVAIPRAKPSIASGKR